MIGGFVVDVRDLLAPWPWWLQCLGVMVAGAVPLIDADFGAAIGVVIGLPVPAAIACGVAGNAVSMLVIVEMTRRRRSIRARRRVSAGGEAQHHRIRAGRRLRWLSSRLGVPGVGLLGNSVAPAHFCAVILLVAGENPRRVVIWQLVGVTLWGTVFGVLAGLGVEVLS